jgi:phage gp46-like protein
MIREALQRLVDDGLASAVDCTAERNGKNRIDYQAVVARRGGSPVIVKEAWRVV